MRSRRRIRPTKAAPAPIRVNNVRRVRWVVIELLLIPDGAANQLWRRALDFDWAWRPCRTGYLQETPQRSRREVPIGRCIGSTPVQPTSSEPGRDSLSTALGRDCC